MVSNISPPYILMSSTSMLLLLSSTSTFLGELELTAQGEFGIRTIIVFLRANSYALEYCSEQSNMAIM